MEETTTINQLEQLLMHEAARGVGNWRSPKHPYGLSKAPIERQLFFPEKPGDNTSGFFLCQHLCYPSRSVNSLRCPSLIIALSALPLEPVPSVLSGLCCSP